MNNITEKYPSVIVGEVDEIEIHQITESELIRLEQGSSGGIYFNVFLGCLSIAITLLVTLLTVDFNSGARVNAAQSSINANQIKFIIFFVSAIVFALVAAICFFLWRRDAGSVNTTASNIRVRMERKRKEHTAAAVPPVIDSAG